MFRLFESIKCLNGKFYNLDWHNERLNRSRKICFSVSDKINLEEVLILPEMATTGMFRCRVTYSEKIEKTEFIPHQFREIISLKLVTDNQINYSYKYSDRQNLEELFSKRENCDDILIVKNGCITDSSTANVLFFDGKEWWTPDTPLLEGTQRARMLASGEIKSCRITPNDLSKFETAALINAMWDFQNMPKINTSEISF